MSLLSYVEAISFQAGIANPRSQGVSLSPNSLDNSPPKSSSKDSPPESKLLIDTSDIRLSFSRIDRTLAFDDSVSSIFVLCSDLTALFIGAC
ncbi:hypothetical protein ACHAWO_002853 [Cyclotella atomus]|uniref:Uncharacterized protein n=1 Tax=Cyclotella atomus TaxID=382360 RepID=A0ABD3QHM8_9STRA